MKLLTILIALSMSCGDDLDYHYEGHRKSSAVNPEIPTAVDTDTKDADISPFSYSEETSIVTVSSRSADGYHKKGDTLEFTVKFSTIVSVESGIPSLEFALKAHEFIVAQALYTGGSGTDSLNFEYTVGENDNAVDIDFSKINSNSALLTTPDGSPVNTLIQSKNFSDTRDISMDNVASVAITLDGIYENDVSANKTPTLHVAGKDIVGFHYKLATNQNSCLSSQGYTNVDALSINLDLSNEASGVKVLCALGKTSTGFVKPYDNGPSSFTWQYDAVLPYVLNLYARSGDDNYNTGSRIIFDIVFSDRVIVAGGTPTLSFQTNASSSLNGEAIYFTGSSAQTLTFQYIVQSGDDSTLLNIDELKLNGSSIKDFAGNNANIYLPPGILQSNNTVIVDTTEPVVSDIDSSSLSGYYKAGDSIVIELKFNEVVSVTGSPELVFSSLGTNSSLANATLIGPSTDFRSLLFNYSFAANDNSLNIDVDSVFLNGGSIKDLSGNEMNPVFSANLLSANKQISVDNVATAILSLDKLNELEIANISSTVLTVSGDDLVGFKYKLTDKSSNCSDPSAYQNVSGSTASLSYLSASDGRQVVCAVGVLASGFQKPYDNGASHFVWFLKTNPPKTPLHIKGLEEVSKIDQITVTITNPYLGAYKYKFASVASGIDCSDSASYNEVDLLGGGSRDIILNMTSEEQWQLCVYAADKIGNWQDIADASVFISDYSPAHIIASVDAGFEEFYNATTAPATTLNPINITVNGSTGGYYYMIGMASVLDCSIDIANYQGPFLETLAIDSYVYGNDDNYKLCLLGTDVAGTQALATEYVWNYDATAPSISNITIANPDGYYKSGDIMTFMLDFTEDIIVDSPVSELELSSTGNYDNISKALGKSHPVSDRLIYEYIVASDDNAIKINVASLILNGSEIKDQAGNLLDLTIPTVSAISSSSVSIDNVAAVVISSTDFNEAEQTNAQQAIISVSGSDIVGFNYKLVSDLNSCQDSADYISVDSTSLTLDLSSVAEGSATLCALGTISSGFSKPADNGASSFSWIEDLSAPLNPVAISGIVADTHENGMILTISDPDVRYYRYKLTLSSLSACSDITNYSSAGDTNDGAFAIIYEATGAYTLCVIASDYAGNWQSLDHATEETFTYSVAAPKITDVRSNASNKSYEVGDQIIFMIDFDMPVTVSGTDSSLSLSSSSSNSQLQNASYHSGSEASTLNYYYTVQANDNGLDVDVASINLATSTITGASSMNADLSLPSPTSLSAQNISVDTVGNLTLSLTGFSEGDQSGLNKLELTVAGSDVSSFQYKIVSDLNECADSNAYISSPDMSSVNLDVSSYSDGKYYVCGLGVASSNYVKDASLASSFGWHRFTECGNVHGSGSSANPYQLRTENDIASINNDKICLSSYYTLENDITLTATNWTPIGLQKNNMPFNGYFDGRGMKISGLKINTAEERSGFFGTTKNASIENLTIEGSITTSGKYSGGLIAYTEETIIFNCLASVSIDSSQDYVGGLIGRTSGGHIMNSSATGDVYGINEIGGLTGYLVSGGIIENSNARGKVFSSSTSNQAYVGGLSGSVNKSQIKSSFATGNVYSTGGSTGGLVGILTSESTISESFSTGNVEATGKNIGGFLGHATANSTLNEAIADSYSIGNVITASGEAGAFVGKVTGSHIKRSYAFGYCLHDIEKANITGPSSFAYSVGFDGNVSNIVGSYSVDFSQDPFRKSQAKYYPDTDKNTIEISQYSPSGFNKSSNFTSFDFVSTWYIDPKIGRPALTNNPESEAYTLIQTESEFNDIRNNLSGYFVLNTNIDLSSFSSGDGFEPIGASASSNGPDKFQQAFNGIIDGGPSRHSIKSATINRSSEVNIGIIGAADKATFRNLTLNAHQIKGSFYVGNLIGKTLSPSFISETEINSSLKLEGDTYVGGVAGSFQGFMANTINKSNLQANNVSGGLVGILDGTTHIITSENQAKIFAGNTAGGIAGSISLDTAYFKKLSNSGTIEHTSQDGKNYANFFGLIENMQYVLLSELSAARNAYIKGNYALGGFVGKISSLSASGLLEISQSSIRGEIEILDSPRSDGAFVGGMIGWAEKGSIDVSESYTNIDILGLQSSSNDYTQIGAFAGRIGSAIQDFSLVNSYFISDIYVAQNTSNCGTLIGTFDRSSSQGSRILKSVYTFGDNYSCYAQSTDIALFGETQPSGLQQAIEDSTVFALSALDTRLSQDSQYQHCFDKNGNSLNCYSSNVTTSDLNYNWTDTFWKNSSCKITTNWPMELIQPELVSNPQGTCAIRN